MTIRIRPRLGVHLGASNPRCLEKVKPIQYVRPQVRFIMQESNTPNRAILAVKLLPDLVAIMLGARCK